MQLNTIYDENADVLKESEFVKWLTFGKQMGYVQEEPTICNCKVCVMLKTKYSVKDKNENI